VDLARLRAEIRETAGDAVVEAGPDADDQVGVVHGLVGFQRAVHAQHAEEARVRRRERAQAHQGERGRQVPLAAQRGERGAGFGAGVHQAAAAVENGTARGGEEVGGALEGCV
jgi:hypothetical protein